MQANIYFVIELKTFSLCLFHSIL